MKIQIFKISALIILLMSLVTLTYGQLSQGGIPYSFDKNIKMKENISGITMPEVSKAQIDSIKQRNNNKRQVFQFAYSFDVNIDLKKESTIDTLEIGVLYRYEIESSKAYSIGVIFSEFRVPRGAKLFLYNEFENHIMGAFTSNNNKESKVLPITPVKGDKMIIEYFEPMFPDFEGELKIGKVGHDFTGFYRSESVPDDFGSSGDCQVDINCPEGNNWQDQKRSVLRIVKGGDTWCSAALINNSNQDGTPYVLTAHHCLCNQSAVDESLFIFNYESPTCGGGDGSTNQSIAGGTLRATRGNTDFTLLELSKKPLSTFTPYYAGWDRNDAQGAGGVGIHHPSGDVKKISTYTMTPESTQCVGGVGNEGCGSFTRVNQDYYRINFAETANGYGTTELASSGSPLFNNDQRIIGQLLGFDCTGPMCTDPANDISAYGRFSSSWNGNNSNQRLRDWLNPANDVLFLDGINGCLEVLPVNLNITHTITSSSVELHQATNTITANNVVESAATATYEAQKIELTNGFIAEEGSNFVARPRDFDNCVVTCDPIDIVTWTSIICSGGNLCFQASNVSTYNVKILTISGALVHQSSGSASSSPFCVWNSDGIAIGYYHAIVTFENDCQEVSNTYLINILPCKKNATDESGQIKEEVEFEKQLTSTPIDTVMLDFKFKVFPNPNDGSFSVKITDNNLITPYSFEIINSLGKVMYSIEYLNEKQININQKGLPKGTYFIRIKSANRLATQKMIIQ